DGHEPPGLFAENAGHLVAVDGRHHDVEQDQVGLALAIQPQCVRERRCGERLVARLRDHPREHFATRAVVIHDEDAYRLCAGSAGIPPRVPGWLVGQVQENPLHLFYFGRLREVNAAAAGYNPAFAWRPTGPTALASTSSSSALLRAGWPRFSAPGFADPRESRRWSRSSASCRFSAASASSWACSRTKR